jgi:hypothetical protein
MSHPDRRRVGEESYERLFRTLFTLSRKAPQSADSLIRNQNPLRGDFNSLRAIRQPLMSNLSCAVQIQAIV